jgi:YVTN family beta-propeller protein
MEIAMLMNISALWARKFAIPSAVIAFFGVWPAKAEPFVYVTNTGSKQVSLIDTATNKMVSAIDVGNGPVGVAVTPDGKHAYIANAGSGTVSVIETATNKVVKTVPVGNDAEGLAITPDGAHVYVAVFGNLSEIDTATNTVIATVPLEAFPQGVAVTPDRKYVYVMVGADFSFFGQVWVIDTATNTVINTINTTNGASPFGIAATPDGQHVYSLIPFTAPTGLVAVLAGPGPAIQVGYYPWEITTTPDSKHGYVANQDSNTVSVFDTSSNTVSTTVSVGTRPGGVAVFPDGKTAYVANTGSNTVSVIDTATNTVIYTVPVGTTPQGVGIIPPPPGVGFAVFTGKLAIERRNRPSDDAFELRSEFILGTSSNGIDPVSDAVSLWVGRFSTTIPAGSFHGKGSGPFKFHGVIDGVDLDVLIKPTGAKRYALEAVARHARLGRVTNPVLVMLGVGDDSGAVSVKADIDQSLAYGNDD